MADIEAAEQRIRSYIPPTPLEYSKGISQLTGRETYLKLETHQPIHVFKVRGALNKLLSLSDSDLKKGVLTASSGNHGLAVAYASRLFGVRATVCVPESVNPQKLRAIQEQGPEVIRHGANYDETYDNAISIARRRGLTFIHAFNDPFVIAGQGTCGLEIARQLPDVELAVVAIGGGGLISGISTALKAATKASVCGAETVSVPSMYISLQEGRMVRVESKPTIADGMTASMPGSLTFEACRKYVDRVGLVTDQQIEEAIFTLLSVARVLAEPAGASPLAAVEGPLRDVRGSRAVLVISGGNISVGLLTEVLRKRDSGSSSGPSPSGRG